MDNGKISKVQPHRAIPQPGFLLIVELPARKRDSGSGVFIQIEFACGFDASFIVISHDHSGTQAPNHVDAFCGVRPIANDVAKADHLLNPFHRNVREDSFQSLEIAVDVGENGEFHEIGYPELPAMRLNRQPCVRSSRMDQG